MATCTCCVCLNKFEGEEPPILMMDREGEALVLCPECTALVEAVAGTPDSPEREAAVEALREMDVKNPSVATELGYLIDRTDAPLTEEDTYDDAEELAEEEPPAPCTCRRASDLYFYLGVGCLAVAFLIYVLIRLLG